MSYYESAYKQVLMGVSQQEPAQRLEGQLTEQVNMTSDIVYGLRRRPPMQWDARLNTITDWRRDNIAVYNTRISGVLHYLVVQTDTGTVRAVDPTGTIVWAANNDYFRASSRAAIRFAAVSDVVYIANVERVPRETAAPGAEAYPNPAYLGYWYGVASAYSKAYDVTVTRQDTGAKLTVSYQTPAGSDADQVAKSTLSYIAEQLRAGLINRWDGLEATVVGGYIGIASRRFPITVTTSAGSGFARTSGNHQVNLVDQLPSQVPGVDDFIMTVGTGDSATYYRYDAPTSTWVEDAAYGAATMPTNMPGRVYYDGGYKLEFPQYERRTAGSTESNPSPHFIDAGITGISAFQGRLVILSNEYVCMSGTNNPLRWYRSSTESVLPNDPVEAAGSDASSSVYVHAVVFNKDLVCFGADTQAVVPGTQAVTPSNVVLAVMSKYRCTLYAPPLSNGRSLYVGANRGGGLGAVWEYLPSDYISSQIIGNDVTSHIPSYLPGTVELLAASTTSGMLAVGYSSDRTKLVIEEYNWNGSEKRQSAWHKWTAPGEIMHCAFEGDVLYLVLRCADHVVMSHIDLRTGLGPETTSQPKLDLYTAVTCTTAGQVRVTDLYWAETGGQVVVFKTSGEGKHLQQTADVIGNADGYTILRVVGAAVGDQFIVGMPYESLFTLTSPQVMDTNGTPVTMHRSIIQRYHVNWANTGTFTYHFWDQYRDQGKVESTPTTFASPSLQLGSPLVSTGRCILPARLDMRTVSASFSTSDVYDLNPVTIEYGYRYNQTKGRRV